jgi:hypothetical protein
MLRLYEDKSYAELPNRRHNLKEAVETHSNPRNMPATIVGSDFRLISKNQFLSVQGCHERNVPTYMRRLTSKELNPSFSDFRADFSNLACYRLPTVEQKEWL